MGRSLQFRFFVLFAFAGRSGPETSGTRVLDLHVILTAPGRAVVGLVASKECSTRICEIPRVAKGDLMRIHMCLVILLSFCWLVVYPNLWKNKKSGNPKQVFFDSPMVAQLQLH